MKDLVSVLAFIRLLFRYAYRDFKTFAFIVLFSIVVGLGYFTLVVFKSKDNCETYISNEKILRVEIDSLKRQLVKERTLYEDRLVRIKEEQAQLLERVIKMVK